jgi:ribose/xylose/arabinose/galactoside ABC-type transport system permease subunit
MQLARTHVLQLLRWPLIAAVTTALLFIIVYVEQHSDAGFMSLVFVLSSLLYVVLAGIIAVAFLVNIAMRKFIRGVGASLALAMMIFAVVWAQPITEQTFHAIDLARFSVSRNHYRQIVAKQKDQPHRFYWGSGGFLATNFFYTLVYRPDESSAIPDSRKRERCSVTVTELRENFFIESELCQ